jgi:hypothetical protein
MPGGTWRHLDGFSITGALVPTEDWLFTNGGTFIREGSQEVDLHMPVQNDGLLRLDGGILNVAGEFTQSAGAVLRASIGGLAPGAGFGQLESARGLNLAGTLELALTGGFDPAVGDTFPLLVGDSRAGEFTSVEGLAIGPGKAFVADYTPTGLTLRVVAVP